MPAKQSIIIVFLYTDMPMLDARKVKTTVRLVVSVGEC